MWKQVTFSLHCFPLLFYLSLFAEIIIKCVKRTLSCWRLLSPGIYEDGAGMGARTGAEIKGRTQDRNGDCNFSGNESSNGDGNGNGDWKGDRAWERDYRRIILRTRLRIGTQGTGSGEAVERRSSA